MTIPETQWQAANQITANQPIMILNSFEKLTEYGMVMSQMIYRMDDCHALGCQQQQHCREVNPPFSVKLSAP
jgi:hypothetical protein